MRGYLIALAMVAAATACGVAVDTHVTIADQAMLYLPAILLAGWFGRGPSLAAAAMSVGAFDFFFVPPRYTFAVSDTRSLITFAVMFVVGSSIGSLVARLRRAEAASRDRERRTAALLAFTRDAAAATDVAGVKAAVAKHRGGDREVDEAVEHQARLAIGRLELAIAAREAALRANAEELRNALLSSVSHDLRTPLAVITGMATNLRDANTLAGPELDTIIEEAQRLGRVLTNLLSITKVESGAAPRREWVPLEELVGSALGRLETELADHPVDVSIVPDALANVDPILVEQLLINLLDNAAKHTPSGTPIDVRVTREPTRAVIEVADRGPGLPPGPPEQMFDRFYRGSTTASGTGLGLAVCRGIVLAHHGGIEARARDGGGARLIAWFPDEGALPVVEELAS